MLENEELARLSRLYVGLSQINQVIIRERTSDELFRRICEVLVEHAGFAMAWIGVNDPLEHRLLPVASAGAATSYLESVEIRTDDSAIGSGPSGCAFRENRPRICNDSLDDPSMAPWREQLARHGFCASAAFPITVNDVKTARPVVSGTLNVYAAERGFFREKEIDLLNDVAADIGFALDKLSHEHARSRADIERERAELVAHREWRFAVDLVESLPGIFYLYDEAGRFLRWNRNFETVSGYSSIEIAKMHPTDFFPPEEVPLIRERIADVFEHGGSTVEATFRASDGSCKPYFFTGRRIQFDGRRCLIGVGVDITERKQIEDALKKSEERYRTTLDTVLEACQLLAFDWTYLYLNPAAAGQNRRPNAELLGRRMQDVWPGIESTPVFALLRRCMEERVHARGEVEYVFGDGTSGWFDVRVQPVAEGVFVLSMDITKRKIAERALRELNDSLERKVAERTRDLEIARARAESADRLKSAFLAMMSHELRTPLNSILGFTGIVLKGMAGPLTEEQSKQLGMVQGSARHLLELINDVLDISKIEAGQLDVRAAPFDLVAAVNRVVALVMPLAEKKGLGLTVTFEPSRGTHDTLTMHSDKRRIEQILINLLNNAIKFTERGSVTLTVVVQNESRVLLRVTDTGIGMKPEDLGKLFQPFRQLDSGLHRQHEGTGLGLAICQRLASLLGGTIEVESTFGEGSVFTVLLPIRLS